MTDFYNICLVPKDDFYSDLIQYSQDVAAEENPRFRLGPQSLPHMTILQFSTDASLISVIDCFKRLNHSGSLFVQLVGLVLLPSPDGDLWCELGVLKSADLSSLQQKTLEGMSPVLNKTINGIGDHFRPHFTVALKKLADYPDKWTAPPLPVQLLRAAQVECTLSIGISGDHYQVTKVVECLNQ